VAKKAFGEVVDGLGETTQLGIRVLGAAAPTSIVDVYAAQLPGMPILGGCAAAHS
jgi:hypothetical protein